MNGLNLYITIKDFYKMVGIQEKQDEEGERPSEMYNDAYLEKLESICGCFYPPIEYNLEYEDEDELYNKVLDLHYEIDKRIRKELGV